MVGVLADEMLSDLNVNPLNDRALALEALVDVDDVMVIKNNLAEKLHSLRPDIVVKGQEFKTEYNEESEIIANWGGKLLFSSGNQHLTDNEVLRQKFSADFFGGVLPSGEISKSSRV